MESAKDKDPLNFKGPVLVPRESSHIGESNTDLNLNCRKQPAVVKSRGFGEGVFVLGRIESEPVSFPTDTGAIKTILSYRVYQRLQDGERPSLSSSAEQEVKG